MKATELRIGNLVNCSIKNRKGRTITHKITAGNISNIDSEITSFNFEPIELTEEWLIKFGFKKRVDGDFDLLEYSEVNIVISGQFDGWKCDGIWFSVNHLEYVHQLQNLYFCLTGEELKIN